MTKRELLARHRESILALAAEHGVTDVRVFGSVARGDDDEASDLDLLVRRLPGSDPLALYDLQDELQRLLACKVDLLPEQPLMRPAVRARVSREAIAL